MNVLFRTWKVIAFAVFLFKELVLSTLRVAWEVITPAKKRRQGIIAVPLDAKTDLEIAILANLITFTPGTLSLDVSSDRSVLYVHTMFVDDPEVLRQEIKDGFERRVLELVRGEER
jgi:multicomponent Na+:H+ antiporter subunit E